MHKQTGFCPSTVIEIACILMIVTHTGCEKATPKATSTKAQEAIFLYPKELVVPPEIPSISVASNSDKDGQKRQQVLRLGRADWYEGHFYGWRAALEERLAGNSEQVFFHQGQSNGVLYHFYERGFNDAAADVENIWNSAIRSGMPQDTLVSHARKALAELETDRDSRFILEINKIRISGEEE